MKIAIASDHGGFELKQWLITRFDDIIDLGCYTNDMCDFPDVAKKMAEEINKATVDLGILICGTGIGMSIAVNRFSGIRGALLYDDFTARLAKEHNNANVLIFGGRNMSNDDVKKRIDIFLEAKFIGDRYQNRINKIEELK